MCKRIVAFFTLLTKTQDVGVKRLGVTQELLSLVTGLAHYLKLLIRISLQGALKLERETRSTEGLHNFLDDLSQLDSLKDTGSSLDDISKNTDLAAEQADLCFTCQQPIDDECIKQGLRRWHYSHLQCDDCHRDIGSSGDGLDPRQAMWSENDRVAFCAACFAHMGQELDLYSEFETVTRLQQYVHLLRIALARLLSLLRSGGILPHTSGRTKRRRRRRA